MRSVSIDSIGLMQMKYFIKAAEFSSFTLAAKNLKVMQSTVSKTVANLEKSLGLQLFIRQKNALQLTPAGNYLYHKWSEMMDDIELSIDHAYVVQRGYSMTLNVGSMDSSRPYALFPTVLRSFQESHPDIRIRFETGSETMMRSLLVKGDLDCFITSTHGIEDLEAESFVFSELSRCPLEACFLATSPYTRKESLNLGDLQPLNFISLSPAQYPSYAKMMEEIFVPYGFTPGISSYILTPSALPLNLLTDNDVFLCNRYFHDHSAEHLCYRSLDNTESGIGICWRTEEDRAEVLGFIQETINSQTRHSKKESQNS